jgi:hemolysin III
VEMAHPFPAETTRHVARIDAELEGAPRLRGWLHVGAVPVALGGGAVLVGLSPSGAAKTGSTVFMVCALMLFSVSGAWHRRRWSTAADQVFRRLDHGCIFLLIAGTYTPVALILLDGRNQVVLLSVVWIGAALGIAFRLGWPETPRWIYTPIYIVLGWVAIPFASGVTHATTFAVVALLAAGGLMYTAGGVVYGLQRPNPSTQWFGFHEVFHLLTVVAFLAHYTAISLAAYSLR